MNRARLIELPPALCDSAPALAALVARNDQRTSTAQIFLGKSNGLSGGTATSYELLQTLLMAALHGTLANDYLADTLCIDLERGFEVVLDGPDLVLDETVPVDALAATVLIVVGDEIMSLAGSRLTGNGIYRIYPVRGRFGTPVQFHPAGAEVYVIRRDQLSPITLPALLPSNRASFKLARAGENIEDQAEARLVFSGGALKLPPPAMITVNGMDVPLVATSGDLEIAWLPPKAGLSGKRVSTLVEFVVPGEDLVAVSVDWPASSLSQAWAGLPAAAADGFTLRLTTVTDDGDVKVSGASAQLVVTVIGGSGAAGAPVINSIYPASSSTSSEPEAIDVYGSGFTNDAGSDLLFNGESSIGWTFISTTHVQTSIISAPAGTYPIYFHNSNGNSNTVNFIAT